MFRVLNDVHQRIARIREEVSMPMSQAGLKARKISDCRGYLTATITVLCVVALSNSTARAQDSASDFLTPIVSPIQYTQILQPIELTFDQRIIAELVYDDYRDSIEEAIRAADREADQAGRVYIKEALSGQRLLEPGQLRQIQRNVLRIYGRYLDIPDEQFDLLGRSLHSVLVDDQDAGLDERIRALRRKVYLHPRHRHRDYYEYAGDGVDLLLLVEEAREEGGELASIPASDLDSILQEYELELDHYLLETSGRYRQNRIDMRLARVNRDQDAERAAVRDGLNVWERLYDLNESTSKTIAELAQRHAGEDAAADWRERVEEAHFSWLFATRGPDRQYEWLQTQELSATQLAQIDTAYTRYRSMRRALNEDAIRLMLEARREHHVIIYSMMAPSEVPSGRAQQIYRRLLRNSGEQTSLENTTTAAFEDTLTDQQRRAMRLSTRPSLLGR